MRLRLALVASIIAVFALGVAWLDARARSAELRAALHASLPEPSAPGRALATSEADRPEAPAGVDTEFASRAALLEEAMRIPEVARREAALRIILGLKASHNVSPPPPRVLPPPVPKDGGYFVELLDDPNYVALQLEQWRESNGSYADKRMQRLGIPADLRRQVINIEFDTYASSMEAARFTREQAAEHKAASAAAQQTRQENETRLRTLLGDAMFARYNSMESHVGFAAEAEFAQLATRLSYSSAPLTAQDFARLDAELQAVGTPTDAANFKARAAAIDARVRAVLRPEQVAAMDELKAEQKAWWLRTQLPKSSELPRTTRRERLEAGK